MHLRASLAAARQPVAIGTPGECQKCGDDMPRLVGGLCGFCRDGRRR
nr:conjugal transfer protein TraR [Sphingomonas abaci]